MATPSLRSSTAPALRGGASGSTTPALRGGASGSTATRIWLQPLCIVGGACLSLFVLTYLVDAGASADPRHVWHLIAEPNPSAAFNTLTR
jgi:hypothetical protein